MFDDYKIRRLLTVCLMVFVAMFRPALVRGDSETPSLKSFRERFEKNAAGIEQLKTSQDPYAFRQMEADFSELIVDERDRESEEFRAERALKLRLALRAFRVIHSRIDPTFKREKDVPPVGLPATVVGYRWGIDPKTIKDPSIRQQYEEITQEIKAKRDRSNMQLTLRQCLDNIAFSIAHVVRRNFKKVNQGEVDRIVKEELPEPAGQEHIRKIFARMNMQLKLDPKVQVTFGREPEESENEPNASNVDSGKPAPDEKELGKP